MLGVKIKDNESLESALRRFKKKCEKSGILIEIKKREVYSVTVEINGRFGFPNNFVEKEFNVLATTRNWSTVCKIFEVN